MSKASNLMEKNAGFVANWLSNLDQLRYNIAKKRHEEGKHVFNKKLRAQLEAEAKASAAAAVQSSNPNIIQHQELDVVGDGQQTILQAQGAGTDIKHLPQSIAHLPKQPQSIAHLPKQPQSIAHLPRVDDTQSDLDFSDYGDGVSEGPSFVPFGQHNIPLEQAENQALIKAKSLRAGHKGSRLNRMNKQAQHIITKSFVETINEASGIQKEAKAGSVKKLLKAFKDGAKDSTTGKFVRGSMAKGKTQKETKSRVAGAVERLYQKAKSVVRGAKYKYTKTPGEEIAYTMGRHADKGVAASAAVSVIANKSSKKTVKRARRGH